MTITPGKTLTQAEIQANYLAKRNAAEAKDPSLILARRADQNARAKKSRDNKKAAALAAASAMMSPKAREIEADNRSKLIGMLNVSLQQQGESDKQRGESDKQRGESDKERQNRDQLVYQQLGVTQGLLGGHNPSQEWAALPQSSSPSSSLSDDYTEDEDSPEKENMAPPSNSKPISITNIDGKEVFHSKQAPFHESSKQAPFHEHDSKQAPFHVPKQAPFPDSKQAPKQARLFHESKQAPLFHESKKDDPWAWASPKVTVAPLRSANDPISTTASINWGNMAPRSTGSGGFTTTASPRTGSGAAGIGGFTTAPSTGTGLSTGTGFTMESQSDGNNSGFPFASQSDGTEFTATSKRARKSAPASTFTFDPEATISQNASRMQQPTSFLGNNAQVAAKAAADAQAAFGVTISGNSFWPGASGGTTADHGSMGQQQQHTASAFGTVPTSGTKKRSKKRTMEFEDREN